MKQLASVLLIGLLASCSRKPAAPPAMPPPEVATVTVAAQPVTLTAELPGRTAPFLMADIRPQVNGLIQKRLFTEGADVTAGCCRRRSLT
jgi:membrane fusion protein (multidrug efflux system)